MASELIDLAPTPILANKYTALADIDVAIVNPADPANAANAYMRFHRTTSDDLPTFDTRFWWPIAPGEFVPLQLLQNERVWFIGQPAYHAVVEY